MQFDDRQLTARLGVALVDQLVHGDLRWIFRELQVSDVGIDGHIEQRIAGKATGRLIGVQIKSGPSWFSESTPDGWLYRGDADHLEYWLEYALPVLLVIVDVHNKAAYWRHVDVAHIERTRHGWKTIIPARQRLDATARRPLSAIFGKTGRRIAPDDAIVQPRARATAAEIARIATVAEKFPEAARQVCARLDAAGLGRVEAITGLPVPPSNGRISTLLAGTHPQTGLPSYLVLDSDDEAWKVFPQRTAHLGPGWVVPQSTAAQRADWSCEALRHAMPLLQAQPDCIVPIVVPLTSAAVCTPGAEAVDAPERSFRAVEAQLADRAAGAVADLLLTGPPRAEARLAATPRQAMGGPEVPLTGAQHETLKLLNELIGSALSGGRKEAVLIVGPSGSGKTTLGLHLLRYLLADGYGAVHSTGSRTLTESLRGMLRHARARSIFRFNNSFTDAVPNGLDVLVCDAAHTLRETSGYRYTPPRLRANSSSQVRELISAARVAVFLLDEDEIVKPGEIGSIALIEQAARGMGVRLHNIELTEIYRWGGSDYLRWVEQLLDDHGDGLPPRLSDDTFTVQIADSPHDMESDLRAWRAQGHIARIAAGFCWPWSDPAADGSLAPDVQIEDWARPWVVRSDRAVGDAPPPSRWPTDPAGFGQIGMIYTVQGFDFGWCGVIMGPDFVRRGDRWHTDAEQSRDPILRRVRNGADASRFVRNTYRVLLTRAQSGVIIYSVDPETQTYLHRCTQPAGPAT